MLKGPEKTVNVDFVDRFLEVVAREPQRTAIFCQGLATSYARLFGLVCAYAQLIERVPLSEGSAVLLHLPRGESLIAAAIACQFRGLPYVPADFGLPPARLKQIGVASSSGITIIDSNAGSREGLEDLLERSAILDVAGVTPLRAEAARGGRNAEAYRIHTSGSTGRPKVVMVNARGCANLLDFFIGLLGTDQPVDCLSATSPGFDIFYLEYSLPLATAGTLFLTSDQEARSPQVVARLLEQHQPSLFQSTPSLLKCLLGYLEPTYRFQRLLVGGEALGETLSAELFRRATWLCNVYGPTETTVWSSYQVIDRAGEHRIGAPIQNTEIYVVDAQGAPLPPGQPGGIVIGGLGVARGYWGQAELSEQKFKRFGDELRYETGDLGVIGADSVLSYLGRDGGFVKINGHRIDPEEIVDAIEALPSVSEAVVIATEEGAGAPWLSAFVTIQGHESRIGRENEIRKALEATLPAYVLPRFIHVVDDIPRTLSGKVDRVALRIAAPQAPAAQLVQRREREVATMLSKFIDVEHLGAQDNFFARGLTSMQAVSFHLELVRHYPSVELYQVFEQPSLVELCSLIREQE